jgi:chromosome partitioning protein
MAKVITISNLKGGVGKSVTAANLAIGLARNGKNVLAIDADAQHSLTVSLGIRNPDVLSVTLSTVIGNIISDTSFDPREGIIKHLEGIDFLPANLGLAGAELSLVQILGCETVLRRYIEMVKRCYDYIVVDTSPSLGLLTLNALAAADTIIVPVVPKYLDVIGLELLLKTIAQIRKQINPTLTIEGILFTMVDRRANLTKETIREIENAYGGKIHIFSEYIPRSVRAAETSVTGISIYTHDPRGRVASAYDALTKGVLASA